MKKLLCVLLALTAVCCFASCNDGKCDDCKTEENVKVYETKDGKEVEYCPSCYLKAVGNNVLGGLLG
ncbi:MAG: hypothetical protein IKZ28_02215 [Clostridia bacterium]|nr:hypothetical protein [Clostridia bacterium]